MDAIGVLEVLPRRVLGATEGRRKPEQREGPYGAPSLCEASGTLGAGRFIRTTISPQLKHYSKRGDLCVSTILLYNWVLFDKAKALAFVPTRCGRSVAIGDAGEVFEVEPAAAAYCPV